MLVPSLFNRFSSYNPKVYVDELDTEYKLGITLPGLKRDEIDVKLDKGRLVIDADNKVEERRFSYYQTFTLSDDIAQPDISANYKDGILTVHLPKTQETIANTKKIEVT